MNDVKKMLRAIINGQSSLKQELLKKIDGVDRKVDKLDKKLTGRIDKIGKQVAYLEDDSPTREEFEELDEWVENAEQQIVLL